jgi:hypothetical protein
VANPQRHNRPATKIQHLGPLGPPGTGSLPGTGRPLGRLLDTFGELVRVWGKAEMTILCYTRCILDVYKM